MPVVSSASRRPFALSVARCLAAALFVVLALAAAPAASAQEPALEPGPPPGEAPAEAAPAEAPPAAPAPPAAAATPGLDLATARVVDLTWTYGEDTLYWPTSPSAFELEELAHGVTEGGWFYSANLLCTPEHGGTHLDAPIHFHDDVWTADEIPADRFVRPAVVIDVAAKAAKDADYQLSAEDVTEWEAEHGRVPEGAIVLLRTGWDARWPDRLAYLGDDTPGDASDLHFPSFGEAAAKLLVERGVVGLGVDTASIDPGNSRTFPVHRAVAGENVYGLENLRGLGELPAVGAWLVALPMKIGGGSGGPARVVALVAD